MTPTIRKILVPTDFGPSFLRTAAYAGALARGLGASIHLLHVLEEADDRRYYEARARLAELASETLQNAVPTPTIEVRPGTPWKAIVDAAIDYGADLVVMSTPEHSTVAGRVIGAVADRVIQAAPCPVVALRQSGAAKFHPRGRAA